MREMKEELREVMKKMELEKKSAETMEIITLEMKKNIED
jgi:hypothetical protein